MDTVDTTAETTDVPLLEGTAITDPNDIYAAYHLGTFQYQIRRRDGKVRRIMNCSKPGERDYVARKVAEKLSTIVIKVPDPTASGPATS